MPQGKVRREGQFDVEVEAVFAPGSAPQVAGIVIEQAETDFMQPGSPFPAVSMLTEMVVTIMRTAMKNSGHSCSSHSVVPSLVISSRA